MAVAMGGLDGAKVGKFRVVISFVKTNNVKTSIMATIAATATTIAEHGQQSWGNGRDPRGSDRCERHHGRQ